MLFLCVLNKSKHCIHKITINLFIVLLYLKILYFIKSLYGVGYYQNLLMMSKIYLIQKLVWFTLK